MKRIDFLGANGIGKSTVYRHLLERRGDDSACWLTLIEAKRKVAVTQFLDERSPKDLAKAATCYLPKMGDIFAEVYILRSAERAFVERGARYQPFFEHCIEHLMGTAQPAPDRVQPSKTKASGTGVMASAGSSSPRMSTLNRHLLRAPGPLGAPPLRAVISGGVSTNHYVNLSQIFGRLKELCLLEPLDDTVVFDESLTHSVTGLLADTPSELTVRTHFEKLPAPDGVVHLTATEDEVLSRTFIKQRRQGGPIVRHRGLDEEQLRQRARRTLRIAEIGASALARRGADVLQLDATAAPEDNAERIEAFLAGRQ